MEDKVQLVEESNKFYKTAAQTEDILNFVLSDGSAQSNLPFALPTIILPNTDSALALLKSLFNILPELSISSEGSAFLLKLLPLIPSKKLFIVLNAIKENIKQVANDPNGSKLIKYLSMNLPRRDKKWLFNLLAKHFAFLAFEKTGSALLVALLKVSENDFLLILTKFVLCNICSLLKDELGVKISIAALKQMENLNVGEFFGQLITINFKQLVGSEVAFPFLLKTLELRRKNKLSVNVNLVNLISNYVSDSSISSKIFLLASELTEEEKVGLSEISRKPVFQLKYQ